jgi:hypothetical protein
LSTLGVTGPGSSIFGGSPSGPSLSLPVSPGAGTEDDVVVGAVVVTDDDVVGHGLVDCVVDTVVDSVVDSVVVFVVGAGGGSVPSETGGRPDGWALGSESSDPGFGSAAADLVFSSAPGAVSRSVGGSSSAPAPTEATPPSWGSARAIAPPMPASDRPAATRQADAATRTPDPTWSPPLEPVKPALCHHL